MASFAFEELRSKSAQRRSSLQEVQSFLDEHAFPTAAKEAIVDKYGAETMDDLHRVEVSDLTKSGVKYLQAKRLVATVGSVGGTPPPSPGGEQVGRNEIALILDEENMLNCEAEKEEGGVKKKISYEAILTEELGAERKEDLDMLGDEDKDRLVKLGVKPAHASRLIARASSSPRGSHSSGASSPKGVLDVAASKGGDGTGTGLYKVLIDKVDQQSDKLDKALGVLGNVEEKTSAIEGSIGELHKKVEAGFEKLADKHDAMFQLMLNLQQADVPRFVLAVPGPRKEKSGVFGWARTLKKKILEKTHVTQYFVLYVIDEAPMLVASIEKDKEPLHDGFEVAVPGQLLLKAAPALYIFAKLFAVVSAAGRLAGFPVPTEIPFVSDSIAHTEKLSAFTSDFEELLEATGKLESVQGAIEDLAGILERKGESTLQDEAAHVSEVVSEVAESDEELLEKLSTGIFEPAYHALKTILEDCCKAKGGFGGWKEFKASGAVQLVSSKRTGQTHWVATKHVEALKATGEFAIAGGSSASHGIESKLAAAKEAMKKERGTG